MLRRFFAALLASVLMSCLISANAAGQEAVLAEQKDITIIATGTELNVYDDGSALRMYLTVENRTGQELDLLVHDANLGSMDVDGYGIFDLGPGVTADEFLMFKAKEGQDDNSLYEPLPFRFGLEVRGEDRQELYYIPVCLERELPSEINEWWKNSEEAAPESTYLELGFFEGARAEWEDVGNDMFKLRVQVRNNSNIESIKAFELYMYATDVYGERIYGEDQVYFETTKTTVGPRDVVYSDDFIVPGRRAADRVYIGVNRIVYSDGTVVEASEIDYWYWTLEWN